MIRETYILISDAYGLRSGSGAHCNGSPCINLQLVATMYVHCSHVYTQVNVLVVFPTGSIMGAKTSNSWCWMLQPQYSVMHMLPLHIIEVHHALLAPVLLEVDGIL
jgi:hypothetical protein